MDDTPRLPAWLAKAVAPLIEERRQLRLAELRSMLEGRHVAPEIIARVMRLNPDPEPGAVLRGIHYKETRATRCLIRNMATKRDFLRRHGRAKWDALPREAIHKSGRRMAVSQRVLYS